MYRIIKRILLIILVIALLLFLFRNFLLDFAIKRIASKIESRYGFHLVIADKKIAGLAGVQLSNLVVLPVSGDTLLQADSVYLRPYLLDLLTGRLKLNELSVANMNVHFSCIDSVCNYIPVKEKTENDKQLLSETDYSRFIRQLSRNVFDLLPRKLVLKNINVRIDKDSIREDISIPFYESSYERLHGTLSVNNNHTRWNMAGVFSHNDKTFDIKIFPEQQGSKGIPLVKNFLGAYCNFDSLEIILSENNFSSPLKCKGMLRAFNLNVVHPKLSDDTIQVEDFTQLFSASVGKDFFELDSTSYIQVNKLLMSIYARYDKNPTRAYSL